MFGKWHADNSCRNCSHSWQLLKAKKKVLPNDKKNSTPLSCRWNLLRSISTTSSYSQLNDVKFGANSSFTSVEELSSSPTKYSAFEPIRNSPNTSRLDVTNRQAQVNVIF